MENIILGFRRLFLLVTPNETSFEKVEDVPNYVNETFPFFFGLIVIEFLLLLIQGKELPRFNDALSSLSNGLLSLLHSLVFRAVELTAFLWVYERFNIVTLPWDSAWTWILCLLGVDLAYYWVHRFGHEVNILWAAHQTHHSSEDYHLMTALRQSVIQRYFAWVFYLPLALFLPPSIFLVHTQFNLLYQFWVHTETVDKLGPLEWILSTPSHHRVHHGRNPYCIDKNYGGIFIIWDRIFGTFEAEKDRVIYGLVHPLTSWEPLHSQYCHFIHIWKTFWTTEGLENKLSVLFKGPGWYPGTPRLGRKEDLPEVELPVQKYDASLPLWANLYVWTHFLILVAGFRFLAEYINVYPAVLVLCFILYIVYSLTTFGMLYDHRRYAPVMELTRCVMFLVAAHYTVENLYHGLSPGLVLFCLYSVSTVLWAGVCATELRMSVKPKKAM